MIKKLLAIVCFLACTTWSYSQCNLKSIPLDNQVKNATQIIEGKVVGKHSLWDVDKKNIYTLNTIEVYKIFKGTTSLRTLEIITPGGIVGLQAEVANPSLNLKIGDIGSFLLINNTVKINSNRTAKIFKPYASLQSFYKYNLSENKVANVFSTESGISTNFYNTLKRLTANKVKVIKPLKFNKIRNQSTSGVLQNKAFGVTSISPSTTTAGTKSVVTISGTDFGANQGEVKFSDADDGGSSFYTALDSEIISWTNTEIQVEVPSRAGTGPIQVVNTAGETVTSNFDLTLSWAEINVNSDAVMAGTPVSYVTQLINTNGSGGYTWQMFTDFDANTPAKEAFIRSLNSWRCETGVNWIMGDPTTIDATDGDGVNVVRFDNGAELPNGNLGVCISRYNGCLVSGGTSIDWFVGELDIIFNDDINWEFGPALPASNAFDFETVSVHELGHGHQLTHVIDTNKIMHFALGNGVSNRNLAADDINGANNVQIRNTTNAPCNQSSMTNFDCNSLSVDAVAFDAQLLIYPNPVTTSLNIKNTSQVAITQAIIYDVRGRLITTLNSGLSKELISIDTSTFNSGLYFLKLESSNSTITKKFIVK